MNSWKKLPLRWKFLLGGQAAITGVLVVQRYQKTQSERRKLEKEQEEQAWREKFEAKQLEKAEQLGLVSTKQDGTNEGKRVDEALPLSSLLSESELPDGKDLRSSKERLVEAERNVGLLRKSPSKNPGKATLISVEEVEEEQRRKKEERERREAKAKAEKEKENEK